MANNKVDVGDHGPFSPKGSQAGSSPATSAERKEAVERRRQSTPVSSGTESAGLSTRGQRSQTIATSLGSSFDLRPLSTNQQQVPQTQAQPMSPRKHTQTPWDQDVDQILRKIPRGSEMANGFWHAPKQPPITQDSLAELDMPRIINNPKLRHDVNFDRELHFRPNLDGSKGKQKLESAELYWKALEGELFMCAYVQGQKFDPNYAQNEENWQSILEASLRRLPNVFKAIRDILKTLVPDFDQQAITDRLDVDLIMREISHGVCDLVDLAKWLGKVLKNHCAPMRDDMVDRMQREIIRGANEQEPAKLVNGLRQLLNILEAMKLDVANHQIRHMRSILIEDTVNFQKRYNAHRIGQGKIDVMRAKDWAMVEMAQMTVRAPSTGGKANPTPLEGLVSALLRWMLFPDYNTAHPPTFYLDVERLRAIRIDLHLSIYHQICRDVLIEVSGARASNRQAYQALSSLYTTVAAIVGPTGNFVENLENIAVEIMRLTLFIEGRSDTAYDPALLDHIEERLEMDLQIGSVVAERYGHMLLYRLLPKLYDRVNQDVKLSALNLQEKLVPAQSTPSILTLPQGLSYGAVCSPAAPAQPYDPDEDIVRRFTHVVTLHWHIWADLIYLVPYEELEAAYSPFAEGRTPPPSPTVPVAQAVYAPGRRWLPIGITVTDVPSGLPTPATTPGPESQGNNGDKQGQSEQENENGKGKLGTGRQEQST